MTADFVVEWQLGRKAVGNDVRVRFTSEAEDVVIPEWTPEPQDDRVARGATRPD